MSRFHFALSHLEDADSLQVSFHEQTFDLSGHTEESLNEARNSHPVLSQLSEEKLKKYTHFTDIPDEYFNGAAAKWVKVVRPRQPGSHLDEVVLMGYIIPPDILRNFYKSAMWKDRHTRRYGRHAPRKNQLSDLQAMPHASGRLNSLSIKPDASVDEDKQIDAMVAAQELVDTDSTASGLLAHHPDLATIQPVTAAYIREAHIFPDPSVNPDQYNAMVVLSNEIANTPSWSPVITCTDRKGNPITADYDLGKIKQGQ